MNSDAAPDDEWGSVAATWDDSAEVRAYAAAAFESLGSVLAGHGLELAGAHTCDFGCGTGLLTERLVAAGARVDAVDSSPKMLEVLQEKVVARPLTGVRTAHSLDELDVLVGDAGRVFDLIVCSSVCGFVPDYPATVVALTTRLRPGGLLVQWDWERQAVAADDGHDAADQDAVGLTRQEINNALAGAGLVDVMVDTAFELGVGDDVMRPLIGVGRAT